MPVSITRNSRSEFNQFKTKWPSKRNYKYSWSTGGSGLRSHLERFHQKEYLKIGQERGWVMQLASIKTQEKQAQENQATLKQEVPFSPDNVTNYLIRFIVANDQVRSTLNI